MRISETRSGTRSRRHRRGALARLDRRHAVEEIAEQAKLAKTAAATSGKRAGRRVLRHADGPEREAPAVAAATMLAMEVWLGGVMRWSPPACEVSAAAGSLATGERATVGFVTMTYCSGAREPPRRAWNIRR